MEPDTGCIMSAESGSTRKQNIVLDAVMMKLPEPCFLKILQT
jgi:hypothetical protein